jgi:hypothetical protein
MYKRKIPMHINYQHHDWRLLVDLFEHIKDSKFNFAEVVSQFENLLKRKCEKYECKEPTNDFFLSETVQNYFKKERTFGTIKTHFNSTTMELER